MEYFSATNALTLELKISKKSFMTQGLVYTSRFGAVGLICLGRREKRCQKGSI